MSNSVLKSLAVPRALDLRSAFTKGVLVFIILNEADIILSTIALYLGSREMNFILASLGSPAMMACGKAFFCLAIVAGLIAFKKQYLFKWLNIGMLLVVIWNTIAVISWS